jgi:hypothetical protein
MVKKGWVMTAGQLRQEAGPGERGLGRQVGNLVKRMPGVEEIKSVLPTLQIGFDGVRWEVTGFVDLDDLIDVFGSVEGPVENGQEETEEDDFGQGRGGGNPGDVRSRHQSFPNTDGSVPATNIPDGNPEVLQ